MKNPFKKNPKQPDPDEQYTKETAYADIARPTSGTTTDQLYSIGRSLYSIYDPGVATLFLGDEDRGIKPDPDVKDLYPIFSQLNRTTNIGERDKRIILLEIECMLMVAQMNMDEATFEAEGWKKLESLKTYGRFMVNDSVQGFKMKALVEQIKQIVTRLEKEKKGRLPW